MGRRGSVHLDLTQDEARELHAWLRALADLRPDPHPTTGRRILHRLLEKLEGVRKDRRRRTLRQEIIEGLEMTQGRRT